jgi:hypothetical protein
MSAPRSVQRESIEQQARKIAQGEGRSEVSALDRIRAARDLHLSADDF